MKVLHQIGDRNLGGNFNSLEEILAYDGPISFDGVYESVWVALVGLNNNDRKIMSKKDVTFFFCHDHLGGNNSFDIGQPLSNFCSWYHIKALAIMFGAKIGYHGRSHKSCIGLSEDELWKEIYPPEYYQQWADLTFNHLTFAWPYGDVDQESQNLASRFYTEAWSVYPKGDDSQFQKNRYFLNWDMYSPSGELVMKAFT